MNNEMVTDVSGPCGAPSEPDWRSPLQRPGHDLPQPLGHDLMTLPHPVPAGLRRVEDGHSSRLIETDAAGLGRIHEARGQVDGRAEDVS